MQICLCVMTMENKTIVLFQEVVGLFTPPLDVKVSQWVEQNRVFSRESSAENKSFDSNNKRSFQS